MMVLCGQQQAHRLDYTMHNSTMLAQCRRGRHREREGQREGGTERGREGGTERGRYRGEVGRKRRPHLPQSCWEQWKTRSGGSWTSSAPPAPAVMIGRYRTDSENSAQ